ncbi:MAG: putative DNA modification/repair radical SAM protein [Actinomycetota bacterium]|nr:putative DNA modification/repair radical SAM protein [Actinomycetota bacterium]
MDLKSKLRILGAAARYDVSCASGGVRRDGRKGETGNCSVYGVCHSWSDDGRCISLLKILFSNRCIYDCAYCANRASAQRPRASFTPDEVVDLTLNFYRRNYIEGLFLSSAVWVSPDYTMEMLLSTVKKLRLEHGFNGYIHLKAIPGADSQLISRAGAFADRMSVNIELPSERSLRLLAPQKTKQDILGPMGHMSSGIVENKDERKRFKKAPAFIPAGQSTQLIVGASPESDLRIVSLAEGLYRGYGLKRIYYSAFVPVSEDPRLPHLEEPPLLREHRLYQADWLMRCYNFRSEEILDDEHPHLDRELDPKSGWALRHLDFFPVEINRADYETLLRVPGLGVKSARRILAARRSHSLDFGDLKKIGVVLKRARFFITCSGRYYADSNASKERIRRGISTVYEPVQRQNAMVRQLSLFAGDSTAGPSRLMEDASSGISGQI